MNLDVTVWKFDDAPEKYRINVGGDEDFVIVAHRENEPVAKWLIDNMPHQFWDDRFEVEDKIVFVGVHS
jgi:hypothetical protein